MYCMQQNITDLIKLAIIIRCTVSNFLPSICRTSVFGVVLLLAGDTLFVGGVPPLAEEVVLLDGDASVLVCVIGVPCTLLVGAVPLLVGGVILLLRGVILLVVTT